MSHVHRSLSIPAEMDARINQIALEAGTTPSVIVGKALSLYLVATEKKRLGLKLGFAKESEQFETEFVGL
ncbi:MAG: transcriptional regulator [Bacteroidota bacterium]|nr:transcriptional regulator [Bacteroidota bacterium]